MTFNVSFKLTDNFISLQTLTEAGFTIEHAETLLTESLTEVLQEEIGDEMTLSCLRVEYDY